MTKKIYLGDGIYVFQTSSDVVLTTLYGVAPRPNTIFLPPSVCEALVKYLAHLTPCKGKDHGD